MSDLLLDFCSTLTTENTKQSYIWVAKWVQWISEILGVEVSHVSSGRNACPGAPLCAAF